MPTIYDLAKLQPIRSEFNSDAEFRRLSGLWEAHIAPVIVELERIAATKPQPSGFEENEALEEALSSWMGIQGRVISLHLSNALRRWQVLSVGNDG